MILIAQKISALRKHGADIEIVQADMAEGTGIGEAFRGIDEAFYLVHSMGGRTLTRNDGYTEKDLMANGNILRHEAALPVTCAAARACAPAGRPGYA